MGTKQHETRLEGIAVSPGLVRAPLVVISREEFRIPKYHISDKDIPAELERLEGALLKTREQILSIKEHLSGSIGEKDASIFDAHLLVVEDVSLLEAVKNELAREKICVEYLYHQLTHRYAQSMREVGDAYLQERAADIMDVGKRVLSNLLGRSPSSVIELDQPSIIVAHDLSPSDTAMLNRDLVLGFATDLGSHTSHTAIMARSLNIPAVVGLKDASNRLKSGQDVILDGYEGLIIVDPTEDTRREYEQIEQRRDKVEQSLTALRETDAITQDGKKLIISANVELPEDLDVLEEAGAEGIGLYRTEFLFLNRMDIPTEEEQVEMYAKFVKASTEQPVIVRTLDIGGDKLLDHLGFGDEMNPFLGWRAIRYCLERRDIFETQLRAICRAAAGTRVRIMFPMISVLEELTAAKQILWQVLDRLQKESIPHCSSVEVGTMVEVPSAALSIDKLKTEVDFVSIGTNDLIQYTLAVDRTNDRVAYLYQPTHPAIMTLIKHVVEECHQVGIWVGVCGEMAGDVLLTPMLLGLGVDELSMGAVFIPRVKSAVQHLDYTESAALVQELFKLRTAAEVKSRLLELARQKYPELVD
jgi:phosphotransferase system enzyme I (PtsI)